MKQFKTVTEFKKVLSVGDQLKCTYHMAFAGRDQENKVIYKDEERPVRKVSIKQTNSFALKTEKSDGKTADSWCSYPKASEAQVENNRITIYQRDLRQRPNGSITREDEQKLPLIPVLSYEFV
jgi:hypothetical protein